MLDVVFDERSRSTSAEPEPTHKSRAEPFAHLLTEKGRVGAQLPLVGGQGNLELGGCMSERLRGLFTHRAAENLDE